MRLDAATFLNFFSPSCSIQGLLPDTISNLKLVSNLERLMLEEIPQKRAAQKLRKKPHMELISQDLLILAVTFQLNIWLCYLCVLCLTYRSICHRTSSLLDLRCVLGQRSPESRYHRAEVESLSGVVSHLETVSWIK
ncbi:hypothetical protein OROMI_021152 [Orobanche minor]